MRERDGLRAAVRAELRQDALDVRRHRGRADDDSTTVTAAGGSALNGTLVFTLYDSGNCTGTVLYTEPTITLSGATSPATRSTTNTTVKVSASKAVSWRVTFTSTDPNVQGSTSGCETTSLTITN